MTIGKHGLPIDVVITSDAAQPLEIRPRMHMVTSVVDAQHYLSGLTDGQFVLVGDPWPIDGYLLVDSREGAMHQILEFFCAGGRYIEIATLFTVSGTRVQRAIE